MKLARIILDGRAQWVELAGDEYYAVRAQDGYKERRRSLGVLQDVKFLPPVEPWNKTVALMDNFAGKKERAGPGLFIKPNSALIGHDDNIVWPPRVPAINFEVELAVVIGHRCSRVVRSNAKDYVLGYTISNDVTSFPVLLEDGAAALSIRFKMYDSFLPLGPWIVTDIDPDDLRLTSYLNGEVKQDISTSQMAFSVAETIEWASAVMTLEPGDVISMGTPPGFVEMAEGDTVICGIQGIGALRNRVVRG